MDDTGIEDAAILLMSLGEEDAAAVFRHLAPKEVRKLGEAITKIGSVAPGRVEGVLERFAAETAERQPLVPDNGGYVKSVLRRALGDDTAELVIDRIVPEKPASGLDGLKWMEPDAVAQLLRSEHPQIVAAVLVHLAGDQAAAVLKKLPEEERNEVMVRIATLDGIQPAALRELDAAMSRVLAGAPDMRRGSLGGAKKAAELVNLLGSGMEGAVLDYVRATDEALAQQIADQLFTFDDLDRLDDKGIQTLLKEVQTESLVVALKGATPQLRDRVLRNMSSRAAESLREDLESRGPVRITEVEAAQKELIKTVLQLADDGQVQLGGGGEQFL